MTFDTYQESAPEIPRYSVRNWSALTDEQLISAHRSEAATPGGGDALSELFAGINRTLRAGVSASPRIGSPLTTWPRRFCFGLIGACIPSAAMPVSRHGCMLSPEISAPALCRNVRFQPSYVDSSAAESLPDTLSADVQDVLESEQLRSRVWQVVMGALNRTEARVMMMHYGEDVPLSDITRDLGSATRAARRRTSSARAEN